jgi:iron complex outermembrane recepter protein
MKIFNCCWIHTSIALCLVTCSPQLASAADLDEPVQFDIPANTPLSDALLRWAALTHLQVMFASQATENKLTDGAKGALSPRKALDVLLKRSGLTYSVAGNHTVTVAPASDFKRTAMAVSSGDPTAIALGDSTTSAVTESSTPNAPVNSESELTSDTASTRTHLEEVLVTGTHINGAANKTDKLIVIDRSQIDESGYSTTQDLIRSLPNNFTGGDAGASEDGLFGNGSRAAENFTGGTGINLRGLGNSSTLVLLNGHRMAASGYGDFVDISMIPLEAIDRVEILPGGSSAIYGSDAVGGVVNVILRGDYSGANTALTYGTATGGGRADRIADQVFGTHWAEGNALGVLHYQSQNTLPSQDRGFTEELPIPNDLLPRARTYSGVINGRQTISDGIEIFADGLFSRKDVARNNTVNLGQYGFIYNDSSTTTEGLNYSVGARFKLSPSWYIDIDGNYSRAQADQANVQDTTFFGNNIYLTNAVNRERSANIALNGTLASLPGGDFSVALGGSYRSESFDDLLTTDSVPIPSQTRRHVWAAFSEVLIPIIGERNQLPALHALELSFAERTDNYSDFGSTTNPRFGIMWSPLQGLQLRGAYSRSFRAPTPDELLSSEIVTLSNYGPVAAPGGTNENIFIEGGGKPLLPEKASITDWGLDFHPDRVRGLNISLDYYVVRYRDRIETPNFDPNLLLQPSVYGPITQSFPSDAAAQAFLNSEVASGAEFTDSLGTGAAGVRSLFDQRQANLALLDQSGADIQASYSTDFGIGKLTGRTSVSFIDKIDTRITPGAQIINLLDTYGMPVRWRDRTDITWSEVGWWLNVATNYTSAYINTTQPDTPPISSWTTVDLSASITLGQYLHIPVARDTTLSLSVRNLFDRAPPFVLPTTISTVSYDPANGSPLGRFISIHIANRW